MNRLALVRRLDALDQLLVLPPSLTDRVLRQATDEQLEELEEALANGRPLHVWDALVAAHVSGGDS